VNAVVRASWIGTVVFTVTAVAAVVEESARAIAATVALLLFAAGIAAFVWALVVAAGRSRTDAIGMGGLFFLAGTTAPAATRRPLLASLAAQVVVALASASVRPFTSVAFGVLVPMYGLGLAGLWGARHGVFGPRQGS
jgi:hypothetical protein